MRVLVEGQPVPLAVWSVQLQGSSGAVWMAPLAVTPCAWSRCLSKEDPGLSLSSPLPSLAQLMTTGLEGQRGRIPATSSGHPVSSHREVSKSVFTFSPAYIFACISSASHPTQNQLFLGQHHPAFSGSSSGNGVTIHIWVIVVGKQLHPHKTLVITTFSYWQAI